MKKEGYIEINYQIAVIMNESGLLRNTYSNVVPNLVKLMEGEERIDSRFKNRYNFSSFTRNNISALFDENSLDYIFNYDALFISTNATNDKDILSALIRYKGLIERFINAGKGIFIGSQKRLSDKENEIVPFLPEPIAFSYKTRSEEKSSEGVIAFTDVKDELVKNCDEENVNRICHSNKFKNHVYRSYILPSYMELFDAVLVDKKFPQRYLLVKAKNQKVIYSTISLDYEEQNALLKNIILYITAGTSSVAFFTDTIKKEFSYTDKFDNILLDAKLNKLSLTIYSSLQTNSAVLNNDIYVVSPDFSFEQVKEFWKNIQSASSVNDCALKKLIYINDSESTETILTEFRNYNETDIQLRYAIQWICSTIEVRTAKKIQEKKEQETYSDNELDVISNKWGLSFWETYDTMTFIFELALAYGDKYIDLIHSYANAFFSNSLSHYRGEKQEESGSYDGMLNCSCALLELFSLFDLEKSCYSNSEFKKYKIKSTIEYIKNYLKNDYYIADIEIVILSLCNIKRYAPNNEKFMSLLDSLDAGDKYVQNLMKTTVRKLIDAHNEKMQGDRFYRTLSGKFDLIETSRDIEIVGYALGEYKNIFNQETISSLNDLLFHRLLMLKNAQTNGCWINSVRTAAILKSLIRAVCISDILTTSNAAISSVLSQIIISAFNFTSNEIKKEGADKNNVWLKDLMATVTIGYSLCLYNSQKRSVAAEIEKSIFDSADNITSVQVIDNSAVELAKMRNAIRQVEQEKLDIIENNEKLKKRTLFPIIMSMVLSIIGIVAIAIWIAQTPSMSRGLEIFLEIVFVPLAINIITNVVMTLNNYDIIKIKRKSKTKNKRKKKDAD